MPPAEADDILRWSWVLPGGFGVQKKDVGLSINATIHRLKSGSLLALRILPVSAKSTTVECSIYAEETTNQRQSQIEVKCAKKDVQIAIEDLGLQQRALFSGDNEGLDGRMRKPFLFP